MLLLIYLLFSGLSPVSIHLNIIKECLNTTTPHRFLQVAFSLLLSFDDACCYREFEGIPKSSKFYSPNWRYRNMDTGKALYECVATIFIAQVYNIDLSFGAQMIVVITALLASIGAASVPMSGLVMMSIILNAVGLPRKGLQLFWPSIAFLTCSVPQLMYSVIV